MAAEDLHGGTVKMPVKPDATGFSGLLTKSLLGQAGTFRGLGMDIGKKLLAGFALVEIGLHVAHEISDSVKIATDAEASTASLQTVIKNAGYEYDKYGVAIEKAQKKGRTFGFTNVDTTKALQQLVIGIKDPAKALDVLGVAQDLAIAKHMDLSSAALLVTKGMEGQTRPLKALGIDLPVYAGNAQAVALAQDKVSKAQDKVNGILGQYPDAAKAGAKGNAEYEKATKSLSDAQQVLADKSSSGDQILKALSDRLGGSAAAAADTYAGKQAAMNATVDNFKEAIGKDILLVLDKLVTKFGGPVKDALDGFSGWLTGPGATAISNGITWIGKYKGVLGPAAGAILGVAAAGVILDAAMDANPIGAVVLGIEALIAVGTALVTNFGGITQQVSNFGFGVYQFGLGIAKSIAGVFDGLANGVISVLQGMLGPLNAVRAAVNLPPIKLPKVNLSGVIAYDQAAYSAAQSYANTSVFGAGGGYSSTGSGGKGGTAGANKAFGDGGTVLPTPGGSVIRVAERGRSETIVDTESLNRAIDQNRGGVQVIQHITTSDPMLAAAQSAQQARAALVLVR
ncbi:MAG: hypothetical protein ABIP33_06485 [Pseudolysinimonas sp.]